MLSVDPVITQGSLDQDLKMSIIINSVVQQSMCEHQLGDIAVRGVMCMLSLLVNCCWACLV